MIRELIAIGGSAGAVGALGQLLSALGQPRISVVITVHVAPRRSSLLAAALQPSCRMPIHDAVDKEPLMPGVVVLAPPDYHLLVESVGSLALSCDPPVHFSRPSIDVLFDSVADRFGARAIGVLLSGASHDGARGLCAIQQAGGAIAVQDPATADATAMPASAIALCTPDLVAAPAAIGAWLAACLEDR